MTKRLLIIPADRISDWIEKGEVLPRYHNPGDVFDEIHILLLHGDRPDPDALRLMAGRAQVFVHAHAIPEFFFTNTLGWQSCLTASWEKSVLPVIRDIKPDLVRCYGAHVNLLLARRIKRDLGVPYLVSLHINPEINIHGTATGVKDFIKNGALRALERRGLREADLIMPVYQPIVPYLQRRGLKRYKVHYNMVRQDVTQGKTDYSLHDPVRVLCVGRQFEDKDPSSLMRAVSQFDNMQMTLVGKGPLHQRLRDLAAQMGREGQFIFHESMDNAVLCAEMPQYDILALHTEYYELSKVMIEGLLAGLPLLVNYRSQGDQVPELHDDICLRVVNTEDGYAQGLSRLITDADFRSALGLRAQKYAAAHWSQKMTEEAFSETYLKFLVAVRHA